MIDVRAIRQEHVGNRALVLVVAVSLAGDFFTLKEFWKHAVALREVLPQGRSLNAIEFLFINKHFQV